MPIRGINEEELRAVLKAHLTPSKEVDSPERLLGRQGELRRIERALNSEGRNIFIFGDRGIGKTSVAVTAAYLNNSSFAKPIYVPCGQNGSFGEAIQAIGNSIIPASQRVRPGRLKIAANVGYAGAAIGGGIEHESLSAIPKPSTITEALDILSYVAAKRRGRTIVVIDEFDRIKSDEDKVLFAELVKNLSPRNLDLRLILCGIGQSVDDILGAHLSSGRYFEPLELEKLHHNFLWDIIQTAADKLRVEIPRETLVRVSIISDGFPHFVHLIGECMFWAMHDSPDEVTCARRDHYEEATRLALKRTEPALRKAYQKATEKTKNQLEYEEALWALADRSETRRQLKTIYEASYKRIISQRKLVDRDPMDREKLNTRLLTLRSDAHGAIIIGYGSGFYAFRENVMRGYVRLKAETEGIELIPDPA
jgi:Cdc6-like AAA superfamily ATPase